MYLEFRVKIKDNGDFKLPVAKMNNSSNPKHLRFKDLFNRDCQKLIRKNRDNAKFINGGSFNANDLPPEIEVTESGFISTVKVTMGA